MLSPRATTAFAFLTAVSFSASTSAPTPLYHVYQQAMALSPLTITLVFASYAFAMLASFLTIARLSDFVGRSRVDRRAPVAGRDLPRALG